MNRLVLRATNLLKTFGGVRALDLQDVSIDFNPGKIIAVLGTNGAGKTTLLNLLNGVMPPDRGTVYLDSVNITESPDWRRARMGMARLWQDLRLFSELDCVENVQVAIRGQRGEKAYVALTNRRRVRAEENQTRDRAISCLRSVGIEDLKNRLAADISYGQQKLLAIARLICNEDIKVALLDEPLAGLDLRMIETVRALIQGMRDRNIIVVLVEHDMHAIRRWVDEAVFLLEGKFAGRDRIEQLLQSKETRQKYMGLA